MARLQFALDTPAVRIDSARLQQSLEGLSVYGRPAGGAFADGVSRLAYSDADVGGRKYAMDLMRAAGLDPRIDAAGNITAFHDGTDPSFKPVLFGSHIDSVPGGGNFDGDLGSMAAIEVIHMLRDHNVRTRHPLRIVIWQNEEGGLDRYAYRNENFVLVVAPASGGHSFRDAAKMAALRDIKGGALG